MGILGAYPFLISFLISLLVTPIWIKLAPKFGFMDIPKDDRRLHKKAMPIAGGVAIYLGVSVCIFLFLGISTHSITLFIASTIILISGLVDDKVGLSPKLKIFFQLLAGIILIFGGVSIKIFTNPFSPGNPVKILNLLSIPFTLFWICGITNTINLIDGLDGLAAGVCAICAIFMQFIAISLTNAEVHSVAAAIAGASIGFLIFNFHPAKIFMGDTGALYLGFMLAYLSIEGFMKSAALLLIFVPVLILGVPVFDTAFAMIRRTLSGHKMMQADKGHLHHRLLERGLGQKKTALTLYAISIVFGIFAYIIAHYNSSTALVFSILLVFAIILTGAAIGMLKPKD